MPRIIVKRSSEYENKARKIKIEINGVVQGKLKDGEEKIFEVNPGTYRIRAKIDWCTSNTEELVLNRNEDVCFTLGSGSGFILYRITFGWNRFLKLTKRLK